MKKILLYPLIFLLLVAILLQLVANRVKTVDLASAPELSGTISQSTTASGSNNLNKNFKLDNVKYFDSGWAAATIHQTGRKAEASLVALQKKDGHYVVVLGSGTSFSSNYIYVLPADVALYFEERGVFYDALH